MSFLFFLYNELVYRPLFNLLVFIYNIVPGHDVGIAIVALTLIVRIALYPINSKSIESQRKLQKIQPQIKKIQKRYKDDKEKQAKALMKFYQENKINPFSGCLPLLIQFPILIALYHVFINGFKDESLSSLYSFVYNPGHIDPISLGFMNLSETNMYLALIAGIAQYFQTKMLMKAKNENERKKKNNEDEKEDKTQDFAQSMTKQMAYIMPIVTVVFAMSFPSGLALYWIATTVFAIVQQHLIISKQENGQ